MTFADRIRAAIGILEGKSTAAQSEIAAITKDRDAAIATERDTGTQLAAAQAQIASFGDQATLESAVADLESLAGTAASATGPAPVVIPFSGPAPAA